MSYFLPLPLRLLLLFRLRFLVPPTEVFAEENIPVNQLSKMPGSFAVPDSGLLEENIPVNLDDQLSKKPGFFAGVGTPGIGVGAPWIGAAGAA